MRIGIYGGTFSPPHAGHIRAAVQFLSVCDLDRLYILPTATPPHKEISPNDDPARRLAMCHLAFNGIDDRIVVSDYEQKRGGKSYTILTLEHFRLMSPDLVLLCGTDMFLTLDKWYQAEEIFKLCYPIYIRRENDPIITKKILAKIGEYTEKYNAVVRRVVTDPIELSSSLVRKTLHEGKNISSMVCPEVAKYIEDHGLFR